MRVVITKPQGGKVDVTIDDSRGITRIKRRAYGVRVEDAGERVLAMLTDWESRREAIREARRPVRP